MSTTPFEQLIRAASAQPQLQRLLFVFTAAELTEDVTATQRQRFHAGHGGALTPVTCVDKDVDELTSFESLAAESRQAGPPWSVVFAAGISGRDGQPPSSELVEGALGRMVERVRVGRLEGLLALDPAGEALRFE